MEEEWPRSVIEDVRQRTDPDLSDEQVIKILNLALRESGKRSGIMFNRAAVRAYEQLRGEGKLTEKRKEQRYAVSFETEEIGKDHFTVNYKNILEVVNEFSLSISEDEILENEKELLSITEKILLSIDKPFNNDGKLSRIAKRAISKELVRWKKDKEEGRRPESHNVNPQKSKNQIAANHGHMIQIPELPDPIKEETPPSFVARASKDSEGRVYSQLSLVRFENVPFPSQAIHVEISKIFDYPPSCELFKNFKVNTAFINYHEYGVSIVSNEFGDEEELFVIYGTGRISYQRKDSSHVIEPDPQRVNVIAISPELVKEEALIELFMGSKEAVMKVVYNHFKERVENPQGNVYRAIQLLLDLVGANALGFPEVDQPSQIIETLIKADQREKLLDLLKQFAHTLPEGIGEQAINDLLDFSEAVSVYSFNNQEMLKDFVATLDFAYRYGIDSSLLARLRKLIRQYSHAQKEMISIIGERNIAILRKMVKEECFAPANVDAELGIMFLTKNFHLPLILRATPQKTIEYQIPAMITCKNRDYTISKKELLRILFGLSPVSAELLRHITRPPEILRPLQRILRTLKEENDSTLSTIQHPEDIEKIPVSVIYHAYRVARTEPDRFREKVPEIEKWVELVEERLLYVFTVSVSNQIRSRSQVFTKTADPMRKQHPLYGNLDVILPDPEKLNQKIEELWEWIKQNQ